MRGPGVVKSSFNLKNAGWIILALLKGRGLGAQKI